MAMQDADAGRRPQVEAQHIMAQRKQLQACNWAEYQEAKVRVRQEILDTEGPTMRQTMQRKVGCHPKGGESLA